MERFRARKVEAMFVRRPRFAIGRVSAGLLALALGACFGSSTERDDDTPSPPDDPGDNACRLDTDCAFGRACTDVTGNGDGICDRGERCACRRLTPGSGGSVAVGGSGGTGGTAGGSACTEDADCSTTQICIDVVGDGDSFCESRETCTCVGVGGVGGTGGTGLGGVSSGGVSSGGTSGRGGTGGTGGSTTTSMLGSPCSADTDCGSAPFVCLRSDGLADGSGPPNGLCTLPCDTDDICLEAESNAYCVSFTEEPLAAYCVEACQGGAAFSPKCHERTDFACGILETIPTTVPCVTTNDCAGGQVCIANVCEDMVTACRPTCGGNFDCASDQFCDFVTGFCVPTEPTGLPIGALCDPMLTGASDPCNGFCLATDDSGTEGTCAAFCSASVSAMGCGWNGTGIASAGCLFATVVSRTAAGSISLATSDLMLCGKLCDCNADCPAASEFCLDENSGDPTASIQALFGRSGYCRQLTTAQGETEADTISCE